MKKRMKRLLMVCALVCVAMTAHAQVTELGVATMAFMEKHHLDAVAKYILMAQNTAETAMSVYDAAQTAIRMEKMVVDNLKSIGSIKNFDDAKNWFNRQLDTERAMRQAVKNTAVKIGNTVSGVVDIARLADSPERFKVSKEERATIYQKMGVSPANYAYMRTWGAMEKDWMENGLGKVEAYKQKIKKNLEWRYEMVEAQKVLDQVNENSLLRDSLGLQEMSLDLQESILMEIAESNEMAKVRAMREQQVKEENSVSDIFTWSYGKSPVNASVTELSDDDPAF